MTYFYVVTYSLLLFIERSPPPRARYPSQTAPTDEQAQGIVQLYVRQRQYSSDN